MKPFIFQFLETTQQDDRKIELDYDKELNLSVIPGTKEPAIKLARMEMDTFTKAGHEPTDLNSVANGTHTRVSQETSDANSAAGVRFLGETHTFVSQEATDTRPSIALIAKKMSMESLTEARETTDVK